MVKRGDMMDVADVLEVPGIDLVGIVPEDELIIIGTNKGEPVVYEKRSRAGRAFINAAQRITGVEVPLDEVEEAPTLVERLRSLMGFGPALAQRRVRSNPIRLRSRSTRVGASSTSSRGTSTPVMR